jgi:hypothetical protein
VHGPVTPAELSQWRGRAFYHFTLLRSIIATNRGASGPRPQFFAGKKAPDNDGALSLLGDKWVNQ